MTHAAVLIEPRKPLEVRNLEVADPGPGEVRVRIAASGVCHSDYHVYDRGVEGLPLPCVLGHEAAGIAVDVGTDVEHVSPGDHVILCVVPQCGHCPACERSQPTLCAFAPKTRTGTLPDGTTRYSAEGRPVSQAAGLGSWSEETTVSAMSVVAIDPAMPLLQAALIGCGVVTGFGAVTNVAGTRAGERVAILGCGGLGLNAVQAARIADASQIIAIDTNDRKLKLASELGATDTVDASVVDVVEAVLEMTGGTGVDASFDFVVTQQTARQVVGATRRGGTAVFTGFGDEDLRFSATDLIRAGRTLKGNLMGMGAFGTDFARLVRLYQEGRLLLDPLISKTFSLSEVNEALHALEAGDVARSVFVF